MKKSLFLILFLLVGCVGSNEVVVKKDDMALIEQSMKRLIDSEEIYLLQKTNWTTKDLATYALSPDINTQCLGLIGAYKGLEGEELIQFTKAGRQIDEVKTVINNELAKRKKKEDK